jgi:CubicO group peptidase (beta-lactamase class C family)
MSVSYAQINELFKLSSLGLKRSPNTLLWGVTDIDRHQLRQAMIGARIPAVSMASLETDGTIVIDKMGQLDSNSIMPTTQFGVASLSKTVFAYLVLKLIEKESVNLSSGDKLTLDTPIHKLLPLSVFLKQKFDLKSEYAHGWDKQMTVRMALSHQTGLKNAVDETIKFKPGKGYRYSGLALMYLQAALELTLEKDLEQLAKEVVFEPLKLEQSSFKGIDKKGEPNAANSLFSTPLDYLILVQAWINDPSPVLKEAFVSQISLRHDKWARECRVSEKTLSHLSWGLGFGLELDAKGNPVKAFHTGDMNCWRSQIVIDLKEKRAITFFASGNRHDDANGHLLSDLIIKPNVPLEHGFDWFFQKFGFARAIEKDWKQAEKDRMDDIQFYLKNGYLPSIETETKLDADDMHQSFISFRK